MKYLHFTFSLILFPIFAQAQKPCGTPNQKSLWLSKFQQHPEIFSQPEADTILYIPMTVHLLSANSGQNYYDFNKLVRSFCQLNSDFAQADIQFYLKGPIHYLASSEYNQHDNVVKGAEMMFAHDVPNTLNTYFVSNPAGNCGYNLPYASIAMSKSCAGNGRHTWAHEIGHAFTLPHPFLGWEGDKYNTGDVAPTTVTYDYTFFKDTLILDTLIIDTAFVELVDGSNCTIAADGFCDTAPDYLSYRWLCNEDNNSPFMATDPSGQNFEVDGSLYMSYSADACQSRFSTDQITAMRAYILNKHPEYIAENQTPQPALSSSSVSLLSPINEALSDPNYSKLIWTSAGSSAKYRVIATRTTDFSELALDTIVSDTSIVIANLYDQFNYYWHVQPFNEYSFCTPISATGKFKADASTVSIINTKNTRLTLSPTYTQPGAIIQLTANQPLIHDLEVTISDMSGRILQRQKLIKGATHYTLVLSEKINNGLYIVSGIDPIGRIFQEKLLIH